MSADDQIIVARFAANRWNAVALTVYLLSLEGAPTCPETHR